MQPGYEGIKCDLCKALDSGVMQDEAEWLPLPLPSPPHYTPHTHPPTPPALGMHEIEQNVCTHPYINYSPYIYCTSVSTFSVGGKKDKENEISDLRVYFYFKFWPETFDCCYLL